MICVQQESCLFITVTSYTIYYMQTETLNHEPAKIWFITHYIYHK